MRIADISCTAVDIFVDSLAVGWSSNDKTYLLTDALPFTPSVPITGVGIWFNWTNYQSTGFYSNNGPTVGSNTHISFTIRSDPAGGIDGVWEVRSFAPNTHLSLLWMASN